jgi:putative transposase
MARTAPNPSTAGMAFVTLTTHGRRPVFQISRVAELFISTLFHYRVQGHYKLHAYLVLPDHVHLILTPHAMPLAHAVRLIQLGFVHRIDSKVPIWEPTYKAYSIRSLRDLSTVRSYLHQVPVRTHLTPTAELYPYSSAYHTPPAPESAVSDDDSEPTVHRPNEGDAPLRRSPFGLYRE